MSDIKGDAIIDKLDRNELHRIAVEGGSRAADAIDDLLARHARLLDAAKAAAEWWLGDQDDDRLDAIITRLEAAIDASEAE